MQYQLWISEMGVSPATGQRWRNKGMVQILRIGKTVFIDQENISKFWDRARAGEFAEELHGVCAKDSKGGSV